MVCDSQEMSKKYPITRLRDLDPRAGTLRFPRDTPLMHNFTLTDAQGREVRNTNHEAHEQFVVHRFLRPDDVVLELGGGIGTNSIQINKTLRGAARAKHVVVEPQRELVELIRRNGAANRCDFRVVHGALSKRAMRVPRFDPDNRTWIFVKASPDASGPSIPTLSNLPNRPTALVADCEGCLLQVLTDFPELMNGLRMLYVENDGGPAVLRGVKELALARGMVQAVDTSHHKLFVLPTTPARRSLTPRPRSPRRSRTRGAAGRRPSARR